MEKYLPSEDYLLYLLLRSDKFSQINYEPKQILKVVSKKILDKPRSFYFKINKMMTPVLMKKWMIRKIPEKNKGFIEYIKTTPYGKIFRPRCRDNYYKDVCNSIKRFRLGLQISEHQIKLLRQHLQFKSYPEKEKYNLLVEKVKVTNFEKKTMDFFRGSFKRVDMINKHNIKAFRMYSKLYGGKVNQWFTISASAFKNGSITCGEILGMKFLYTCDFYSNYSVKKRHGRTKNVNMALLYDLLLRYPKEVKDMQVLIKAYSSSDSYS